MIYNVLKNKAFTLTELMATVAIVGVIALFGIPNYTRAVAKVKERDAISNVALMKKGLELYLLRNNGNNPGALANVNAVNTALNLGIIAQEDLTYTCGITGGGSYACNAAHSDGWTISVDFSVNNGLIYCSVGSCPTCKSSGSGGCPIDEP